MADLRSCIRTVLATLCAGVACVAEPGGGDAAERGFDATPKSLDFGSDLFQGEVYIIGQGGSVAAAYSVTGNAPWMQVEPSGGEVLDEIDTILVTVDRNGLSPRQYAGSLSLQGEAGSPIKISARMMVEGTPSGSESEPNDVLQKATPITSNAPSTGYVGAVNDPVDWFRVNSSKVGTMALQITNTDPAGTPTSGIAAVQLIDALGVPYTTLTGPVASFLPPGATVLTSYVNVAAGATYLLVGAGFNHDAHYRIEPFHTPYSYVERAEPNDTRTAAAPLNPSAAIEALIGFGPDAHDWYRVDSPFTAALTFTVDNLGDPVAANGDLRAALFGPTGSFIIGSPVIGAGQSWTGPVIQAGTNQAYYIDVLRVSGHSAPYRVSNALQ